MLEETGVPFNFHLPNFLVNLEATASRLSETLLLELQQDYKLNSNAIIILFKILAYKMLDDYLFIIISCAY